MSAAAEMYKSGASSADVAIAFGLGETTVQRWMRVLGIARSASESKGVSREMIDAAIESYESGLSVQAVADKIGIGTSTIHRALVSSGKSRSLKDLQTPDEVKAAAIAMYTSGMTTYEVAEAIGKNQATIASWTRDCSVSRGYSGAQALRISKDRHHTGYGKKCWLNSAKAGGEVYCASTYELARLIEIERDEKIVSVRRCSDIIKYGNRRYTPDFIVEHADGSVFIEEVKPHAMTLKPDVIAKAHAAISHYEGTGREYRIVTEVHIAEWAFDLVLSCGARFQNPTGVKQSLNSARWNRKVLGEERIGA
jgi:transposase-like protein